MENEQNLNNEEQVHHQDALPGEPTEAAEKRSA